MVRFAVCMIVLLLSSSAVRAQDYIWWEAESARATDLKADGAYAPTNAAEAECFSEGKWLSAGEYAEGSFAEYDIEVPKAGAYKLFVRRFWNHGPFKWRADDGDWQVVDKDVGFLHDQPVRKFVNVSWIPAGEVKLAAGKHVLRVEMIKVRHSGHDKACGFDCFVLSPSFFIPNGKYKPGVKTGLVEPGMWAFEPDADLFRDSPLDLRYLNERTAGESGYVTMKNGKFFLGNGKETRFWSVVLENKEMDMASLDYLARQLAKQGVNQVRLFWPLFEGLEPGQSDINYVNPHTVDAYHRAVAAFKKQGIYSKICTYFVLTTRVKKEWKIEGVPDYVENWYQPFSYLMFNEQFKAAYKERNRKLFTAKSPYTGLSLAEDPAVAIIQIQNEDGFFFGTYHANNFMLPQWKILCRLFGDFLAKKYGSVQKAMDVWGLLPEVQRQMFVREDKKAGNFYDEPENGLIQPIGGYCLSAKFGSTIRGVKDPSAVEQQKAAVARRQADTAEFLMTLQGDFYKEMTAFFRDELKCKALISACNWRAGWDANMLDMERATYRFNEVIDDHHYMSPFHVNPTEGSTIASWSVRPGDLYADLCALKMPWTMPNSFKHYAGKASIISETAWSEPNLYQVEAPLVSSAYAALNGLDGFYWFAVYVPGYDTAIHKFPTSTPQIMGQFPGCALVYRKGYIAEGPVVIHEDRTLEDMYARKLPVAGESTGYDPLRDKALATEIDRTVLGEYPLAYCVGRVEWQVADRPGVTVDPRLKDCVDMEKKEVRSVTGETVLNWGKGTFVANAPKAQGITGAFGGEGPVELADVTITLDNPFGAVLVVPLDDRPLAESKKILIQAAVPARLYGRKTEPATVADKSGKGAVPGQKILDLGRPPYNVELIAAKVSFGNKISSATALDPNGYPDPSVKVAVSGNTVTLPPNALYTVVTRK